MKICPYCFSKLSGNVKKCKHCGEWIIPENSCNTKQTYNKNSGNILDKNGLGNGKFGGKLSRFFSVLYFIITIPVLIFIILGLRTSFELKNTYWFHNHYYSIFWIIVAIIIYLLVTDGLKRIVSYIKDGSFKGRFEYKVIFTKYWYIFTIIIVSLLGLFYIGFERNNKIRNACLGDGEIIEKDLSCSCDINNGYEFIEGKCKKSDGLKLVEAIEKYILENNSLSREIDIRSIFYLTRTFMDDNVGLGLIVDTHINGGALPENINSKYSNDWDCFSNVEGISNVIGQGYIIAFEKKGGEYLINDLYKVPDYYGINAIAYPYLNTKKANYENYGGEKPESDEDENLLERTEIIYLRDLDGDGMKNEFFLINHIDDFCGVDNFLALGYNPKSKKIYKYRFKGPHSEYMSDWTTLMWGSQNAFKGGKLSQDDYGGHGVECEEHRTFKFNKESMTFETKDYIVKQKCEYYSF